MRVLVAGARGYVGSRLVPALLDRGHEVVATATAFPKPGSFGWQERVEWVQLDATDPVDVNEAVRGIDAVCYLVHALDRPDFAERDRIAAEVMRDAVSAAGVPRLVYFSGLVPDVPVEDLSPHLHSRLEVEQVLSESSAATLSLRAGVVVGAGSTSFEIIRQLASALLVQPVPSWLHARVQPIAVRDVVTLLADALEAAEPTGHRDVGGPDVLSYPELLALVSRQSRLLRVQLPAPPVPVSLVALSASLLCAAPLNTVRSLVVSLQHDMVCDPEQLWPLPDGGTPLEEAVRQSLRPSGAGDVQGPEPSDPGWTSPAIAVERLTGIRLPLPRVARVVTNTAEHRLASLVQSALRDPSQG